MRWRKRDRLRRRLAFLLEVESIRKREKWPIFSCDIMDTRKAIQSIRKKLGE